MVSPDAVTVSTIHSVKGLEFAARFRRGRGVSPLPRASSPGGARTSRTATSSHDSSSTQLPRRQRELDGERRLMYVALTRAERYLFITSSKPSAYFRKLESTGRRRRGSHVVGRGARPADRAVASAVASNESRLVTSFSDLRYFMECSHDFYMRKVLGFTPTIDQAFGYGRGVHNLMREVHLAPAEWAALTKDRGPSRQGCASWSTPACSTSVTPLESPPGGCTRKGSRSSPTTSRRTGTNWRDLEFEPEREFEVLLPEENVLVTGAIDVVRRDSPPRVSIIDFKSGEATSDRHQALDHDEMRLQVSIYAMAAKQELQYEPELRSRALPGGARTRPIGRCGSSGGRGDRLEPSAGRWPRQGDPEP